MVSIIIQQDGNCCALACIESLSKDKTQHITQQQIIDRFPTWCHKGEFRKTANGPDQPRDGEISPYSFFQILIELGLAKTFIVGRGKDFIQAHADKIDQGIFLHTTNHHDGTFEEYHCWRLENPQKDDFYFVEPAQHPPGQYKGAPWDYLEKRGCMVIVCCP